MSTDDLDDLDDLDLIDEPESEPSGYQRNNGFDPARSLWSRKQFLIKDLPVGAQQKISQMLAEESREMLEYLSEKEAGYPSFKREEYSEGFIRLLEEEVSALFRQINAVMTGLRARPLFPDPEDIGASARRCLERTERRPYAEMVACFGCEYPDYRPPASDP